MKFIIYIFRKRNIIFVFLREYIKNFIKKNLFIINSNYVFDNNFVHKPNSNFDPLKSQKGQVRFVLENCFNYKKNGLKREGYFVDLAAAHPENYSNTFFLENKLGWKGILIEINPHFLELLRKRRTRKII